MSDSEGMKWRNQIKRRRSNSASIRRLFQGDRIDRLSNTIFRADLDLFVGDVAFFVNDPMGTDDTHIGFAVIGFFAPCSPLFKDFMIDITKEIIREIILFLPFPLKLLSFLELEDEY